MGSFDSFWDLIMLAILLWAGCYALYTAIRLKREYYLFDNKILYPGKCDPANCLDVDAFIAYIFPRILGFGIALLLFSGLYALSKYTNFFASTIWFDYIVMPATGVAIFVWYLLVQRKASKKFW